MSSPQSSSGEQPTPARQEPSAYPTSLPVNAQPGALPAPESSGQPYPGPDSYGQPYPGPDSQTVALGAAPTSPAAQPDYVPAPAPAVAGQPVRKHSRTGAAWVALIVAAIVFVFLLIFVVQNPDDVQVKYLWFEGTLSLGVAMLFAAVAGALTAGLLGTVRILQLRSRARKAAAGK
jgi:uncharacterized integral membrane protein